MGYNQLTGINHVHARVAAVVAEDAARAEMWGMPPITIKEYK